MIRILFILDSANTQVITIILVFMTECRKLGMQNIFVFVVSFQQLMFMTSLFVFTMPAVKLVSPLI